MNEVTIAGQRIELKELSIQNQKGLWLELIANGAASNTQADNAWRRLRNHQD